LIFELTAYRIAKKSYPHAFFLRPGKENKLGHITEEMSIAVARHIAEKNNWADERGFGPSVYVQNERRLWEWSFLFGGSTGICLRFMGTLTQTELEAVYKIPLAHDSKDRLEQAKVDMAYMESHTIEKPCVGAIGSYFPSFEPHQDYLKILVKHRTMRALIAKWWGADSKHQGRD
jgi:hypothetical protein